ncbi:MAG: chromate efflux transporter [Desulfamplus sp.]|nr:chromate efflux transporter [Desulfamplus sp.]
MTKNNVPHPSFLEAFKFWLKLGFISFGGPAGQIAIMHEELVDKKRWISNSRFLNALNYCMLLPGPEAQQLTIYIGWLLHKIPGGIVAGSLFVIPSMFILFALSYIYAEFGNIFLVESFFNGLKASVMAIVFAALIKIGKKSLKNSLLAAIAALSFIAIFFLKIPFPVIIIVAGLIGIAGSLLFPDKFQTTKAKELQGLDEEGYVVICEDESDTNECHIYPSTAQSIGVMVAFVLLWAVPVAILYFLSGQNISAENIASSQTTQKVFYTEALFFTKAAFMTFGGAYSVLAYIAQAGVEQYAWLTRPQMMDGLGLAETTPGPLIMVVQFVGFMAGWNYHGDFSPLFGAFIGSLTATYFTFLPCFMFILLGAPYIEKFRDNQKLGSALSGITAAVVGVILNLAVWFGMYVIFPQTGGVNWFAVVLGILSFIAMQQLNIGMIKVIAISGVAGVIWSLF